MHKARRIGLTTRVVNAVGYEEPRDALAHDWACFMAAALPEPNWLAIPNIGTAVLEYVERWQLDGLILTGGDDLGVTPQRDRSEQLLLEHFISAGLPVFGVCRGLQMICSYFGLDTTPIHSERHVATRHPVRLSGGEIADVNSYHSNIIFPHNLPQDVDVLAWCDDGSVEAIGVSGLPIEAVMWHPEREREPRAHDRFWIRKMFGWEN